MRTLVILFFIYFIYPCIGFFPRRPPHYKTKTHYDITTTGCLQAIAEYIHAKKTPNSTSSSSALDDFFGTDYDGKIEMLRTVGEVRNSVADTQDGKRHIAYIHCHAEQIQLAHNSIIACRDGVLARAGSVSDLRSKLGECLYTIQAFYSNTNWVEMFGRTPYYDFGIKGKVLMPVAGPGEDTCKDMDNININCRDNLLVTDKLTSGYHHGRGNRKPSKPLGSAAGKCSHGGPDDESRKIIAKCGINKDTTLQSFSPHYHLHVDAYYAAVAATKHFLVGNGTGILLDIGDTVFDSLFHVKQRKQVSLSFAVDYSGSMGGEIADVKIQIIQIVTSTMGSVNEPADYILSLFSDPVELTRIIKYTDGSDFIDEVTAITVNGGGDCPEYAADGVLKAIENSKPHSTVFVFSDADAKDGDRLSEVTTAATDKNIIVTSLLTGRCPGRKRRAVTEINFFESLANSTGGVVYYSSKSDFDLVLEEAIKVAFPPSEVIIESYRWESTLSEDQSIIVDSSIHVLKIKILKANDDNDIDFLHPNGTTQLFPTSTASRIYTTSRELIMSFQRLLPGTYYLHKTTTLTLDVNITAQSSIKMEEGLLKKTESSALVEIKGSPIIGNNYTIAVTIFNLGNGTCNEVSIVDAETGKTLQNYEPEETPYDTELLCSSNIVSPNQTFQIRINVSNEDGVSFFRTMLTVYKPTSVELSVTASTDDVPIGKEHTVYYNLHNTGTDTDTYDVTITDDYSYASSPTTHEHTVNASETVNGSFTLTPHNPGIFTYKVALTLQPTSEVKQMISKSLVATRKERPHCEIRIVNGDCAPDSLNTANCSKYTWNSEAEVIFHETQLESISHSGGSSTFLTHDNITAITSGPLQVNISGTCCIPSLTVSVVDVDGYISQCNFDLSDGKTVEPVDPVEEVISEPVDKPISRRTYAIIVAVTVCVVILFTAVVFGIAVNIWFRKRIQSNDKDKLTAAPNKNNSFANRLVKFKTKENKQTIELS